MRCFLCDLISLSPFSSADGCLVQFLSLDNFVSICAVWVFSIGLVCVGFQAFLCEPIGYWNCEDEWFFFRGNDGGFCDYVKWNELLLGVYKFVSFSGFCFRVECVYAVLGDVAGDWNR